MTVRYAVRSEGPEYASAVRRLAGAREDEARLCDLSVAAAGTRTGPLAECRLSEGRAYVASREQWLHWIEERESLAPWADDEWGRHSDIRQARQGVGARDGSRGRPASASTPTRPGFITQRREPRCLMTYRTERTDRAGAAR